MSSPTKRNHPTDIDAINTAFDAWVVLDPATQVAVSEATYLAETNRVIDIAKSAQDFLQGYSSNPRVFVALLLLATATHNVNQAAMIRVYQQVAGKRLQNDAITKIAALARTHYGDNYGLRRGQPFMMTTTPVVETPKVLPPAVEATPAPAPVSTPTPVAVVAPTPAPIITPAPVNVTIEVSMSNKVRARFYSLLDAALASGEKVVVQRDDAGYLLTYEDNTTVRITNKE